MNKTQLVMRYEIWTVLKSKSFLITAIALPLVAVLIFAGISIARNNPSSSPASQSNKVESLELEKEGFVDLSGFIQTIAPQVPAGILTAYPDEPSAQAALAAGEITAYYLIPADYIEKGDLLYIKPDYQPLVSGGQSWVMESTIFVNLLGNDTARIERAWNAMTLRESTTLASAATERDDDNPLTFYVPYGTMMIFYMVIIMSASLLLNSISNEKKNRVMEVLLVSINPREMLTGKILGLGLMGLLQVAIWLVTGFTLLRLSGQTFNLPPGFQLPPSILAWGIVFFLLGYAIYASLMAGLGALVPNLKEASQAVIVVIWPMLIPLLLIVALIESPHGVLATGMSLFPLTAPVAMMARLTAGNVPWWQLGLSVVLMLATAMLVINSISRLFHAQTLLSGQPFSARRFYGALIGRN